MRSRIVVRGVVQGVGFRPFVHRLATRHGLGGFVLNDGHGVSIEAEGKPEALSSFTRALCEEAPALASVETIGASSLPVRGERDFRIEPSPDGPATALIPPDVS